jgi:hypothetical protein
VDIRCQQLFGFVPEHTVSFKPLRVLSGPEKSAVDSAKINNALGLYDRHLLTDKETLESLDKEGLLNVQTEIQQGLRKAADATMAEGADGEDAQEKLNALVEERKEFARRDSIIMSLRSKKKRE